MGIFDPVNAGNPDAPISTVAQYQRAMNRATYSPAVAQAAARSGVNPTLATRIASREVAQQMGQALPALIQQDAAAMEARRLENERKERERIAMMLNSGGQVLGTVLNAYSGGTMGAATNGAGQAMSTAPAGLLGSKAGAVAANQPSMSGAPGDLPVAAPVTAANIAPLTDRPSAPTAPLGMPQPLQPQEQEMLRYGDQAVASPTPTFVPSPEPQPVDVPITATPSRGRRARRIARPR